jgi:hypothetical protein
MFKVLIRALIILAVVSLTGLTIYWLGQGQATATPTPFRGERPPFGETEGRLPFAGFERERFGEREGRISLVRGLSGLVGNLAAVAIIVAIIVIFGRVTRLVLDSAPLPKENNLAVRRDEG